MMKAIVALFVVGAVVLAGCNILPATSKRPQDAIVGKWEFTEEVYAGKVTGDTGLEGSQWEFFPDGSLSIDFRRAGAIRRGSYTIRDNGQLTIQVESINQGGPLPFDATITRNRLDLQNGPSSAGVTQVWSFRRIN